MGHCWGPGAGIEGFHHRTHPRSTLRDKVRKIVTSQTLDLLWGVGQLLSCKFCVFLIHLLKNLLLHEFYWYIWSSIFIGVGGDIFGSHKDFRAPFSFYTQKYTLSDLPLKRSIEIFLVRISYWYFGKRTGRQSSSRLPNSYFGKTSRFTFLRNFNGERIPATVYYSV